MTAAISVSNARLRFGETAALNGVSLDIPQGTCFGIVGESGSGKTTLMRAILGLQRLDQGEIRIRRQSVGHGTAPALSSAPASSSRSSKIPAASLSPRCRIGTLMDEVGTVLGEPQRGNA